MTAYSTIGPYHSGVWLVSKNGAGAVVDAAHLPPEGTGFEYYWLGTTTEEAGGRLWDAISKLGVNTNPVDHYSLFTPVEQAFSTGEAKLPDSPSGILGAIQNATNSFVTGPLGLGSSGLAGAGIEGTAEGAGAAEGTAGGAAAGAATGGGSALSTLTTAGALTVGVEAFAAIWAWLTTSSHWLRILEYVGGALLIYLGIRGLAGL